MKHLMVGELTQLLSLDSDPPDKQVEEHLETCELCQKTLEGLAAADEEWTQISSVLKTDETDVDLPYSLTTQFQLEIGGVSPPPVVPLTFLDTARHPELLGRLGKYDIESVIGQGGMGIVLRGFDPDLNRPVAVKVLAPWLATSGTARKRFAREARAAAAVVHEHVVAIHGIETDAELPYLVMEFVPGESLQEFVDRNGPLEANEILRIGVQVASGLAAAHDQGLVHRDVKPANILLHSHIGRVQITDFGLARAADEAAMTMSGVIAGTPHYMSPEQAGGMSLDARSDLFSLGSTFYFMATGQLPFRASGPMAVLNHICHSVPTEIRENNPDVPQHLVDIISKLLSKDAQHRFQSAEELREAMAAYLAHRQRPLAVPRPAGISLPGKRSIRSYRAVIGAAAIFCAAISFGVYSLVTATRTAETKPTQQQVDSNSDADATALRTTKMDLQLVPLNQIDEQLFQLDQQIGVLRDPPMSVPNSDSWTERMLQIENDVQQLQQVPW